MSQSNPEPLSPELILVGTPEQVRAARERLDDPPESVPRVRAAASSDTSERSVVASSVPAPVVQEQVADSPESVRSESASAGPSEASWDEFLADLRSRPVEPVVTARPRPSAPVRRKGRKRLLIATAVIVAVAAVLGLGWARDRAQQGPGSSATAMPAPTHRQVSPPSSGKHATSTPAPGVTTAPKPSNSPPKSPKQQPRARRAAAFVPTRTWSWAATPGARAYVVRFLRNGHKVLKVRTVAPRLVLPSRFTFAPGRYRWTVTALPRSGKGRRVIVNSSFTVSAPNG